MVIRLQNYTLNQFHHTHYNQFFLDRRATINLINASTDYIHALNSSLHKFFHMFDTNITFPTQMPPGEAYFNFLQASKNVNQTTSKNSSVLVKNTKMTQEEIDALKRLGIDMCFSSTDLTLKPTTSSFCSDNSSDSFKEDFNSNGSTYPLSPKKNLEPHASSDLKNILILFIALTFIYYLGTILLKALFGI